MKTLILPKKYLSYSAISLWNSNKEMFRKRYYENIKSPDNVFTIFGKEIEKQIYAGEYSEVPFFGNPQHELKIELKNLPILGYLDSFNERTKKFLDYKTSLHPWTQVDVQKLDQLPFYSLLVFKKYGKFNPICNLVWLETAFKKQEGLLQQKDKIIFTGNFKIFKRKILKWELKKIESWIIKSANEISNDFRKWKKSRQADVKGALLE